jgi:hypothetical protein
LSVVSDLQFQLLLAINPENATGVCKRVRADFDFHNAFLLSLPLKFVEHLL